MSLKRIHLELARDQDNPQGRNDCGYDLVAPLDADGHIDAKGWQKNRQHCRVRRFWTRQPDEVGHLIRKRGGAWAFHYDVNGDPEDDEVGYRFANHQFRKGEYLSIKEHDDSMRTFRVVAVTDIVALASEGSENG